MRFHRTVRGADIVLELLPMGEDWAIILSGGEAPHLGGVAAVFRGEVGSLTPETLSGPGHRDAELAAQVAGIVARATGRSVAVLCGIHYDAATKDEIARIVAACLDMTGECVAGLPCRVPLVERYNP